MKKTMLLLLLVVCLPGVVSVPVYCTSPGLLCQSDNLLGSQPGVPGEAECGQLCEDTQHCKFYSYFDGESNPPQSSLPANSLLTPSRADMVITTGAGLDTAGAGTVTTVRPGAGQTGLMARVAATKGRAQERTSPHTSLTISSSHLVKGDSVTTGAEEAECWSVGGGQTGTTVGRGRATVGGERVSRSRIVLLTPASPASCLLKSFINNIFHAWPFILFPWK